MNMRTITFNELRKIKDSLPSGSMHRIADELGPVSYTHLTQEGT